MDLKKIIVILVVAYAVVSLWMIGAPYIKNAMFSNDLDNIARYLSVDGTVSTARKQVKEAIDYHGVPVPEDGVTIVKDAGTRQVLVEVRYSVSVTTPFGLYTHVWHFAPRAEKGLQRIPNPAQ